MLDAYNKHVQERALNNIPPRPLTPEQTKQVIRLLASGAHENKDALIALLTARVPPGVDPAAKIKADFLYQLIQADNHSDIIPPQQAVELLGAMQGGIQYSAAD
ncbi:hypothetical protein OJE16_20920 [Pantoea tagorei]